MRFACFALLLAGLLAGPDRRLAGQDKPAPPGQPERVKGQLPIYWKQLGLSDDQRQQVYKIKAKFNDKEAELLAKIKDLKEQERKELEVVLTDAQKVKLRDIVTSKVPGGK